MGQRPAPQDFRGWVAQLARDSRRKEAKAYLLASGPAAVTAIREGLDHEDAQVRRQCVNLLDHLVDDDSVASLVRAIHDPDDQVAARALHALAYDRCKEGACRPGEDLWVPQALRLLSSDRADLRAGAIEALGKVVARRPEVRAALAAAASSDPDKGLRGKARRLVPSGA